MSFSFFMLLMPAPCLFLQPVKRLSALCTNLCMMFTSLPFACFHSVSFWLFSEVRTWAVMYTTMWTCVIRITVTAYVYIRAWEGRHFYCLFGLYSGLSIVHCCWEVASSLLDFYGTGALQHFLGCVFYIELKITVFTPLLQVLTCSSYCGLPLLALSWQSLLCSASICLFPQLHLV